MEREEVSTTLSLLAGSYSYQLPQLYSNTNKYSISESVQTPEVESLTIPFFEVYL